MGARWARILICPPAASHCASAWSASVPSAAITRASIANSSPTNRKMYSSSASWTPTSACASRRHASSVHQHFIPSRELVQAGVQAASVAVPTAAHLDVARQLMPKGVDVLIEKPLTATLAEADEMIGLAERYACIAQTGHLERFNPAVRATLPLLTQPMFFEVHRLSVFTPRSLDVDVVLDLMIHDIDIVLTFAKSSVKEIRAVGLPILSPKTDIANVRMEFESGCVANFTASRVSTERVRKLRFFQPHQYVSLDYSRQDVLVLTVDDCTPEPWDSIRSIRPAWPPARFPASRPSSRLSSDRSRCGPS